MVVVGVAGFNGLFRFEDKPFVSLGGGGCSPDNVNRSSSFGRNCM